MTQSSIATHKSFNATPDTTPEEAFDEYRLECRRDYSGISHTLWCHWICNPLKSFSEVIDLWEQCNFSEPLRLKLMELGVSFGTHDDLFDLLRRYGRLCTCEERAMVQEALLTKVEASAQLFEVLKLLREQLPLTPTVYARLNQRVQELCLLLVFPKEEIKPLLKAVRPKPGILALGWLGC